MGNSIQPDPSSTEQSSPTQSDSINEQKWSNGVVTLLTIAYIGSLFSDACPEKIKNEDENV